MTDNNDGPSITFERGTEDFLVSVFGWEFDEFDFLVNEHDHLVEDLNQRPIQRHQLGGVFYIDGHPVPVKDNFPSIVDAVSLSEGREPAGGVGLPELPDETVESRNTLYDVMNGEVCTDAQPLDEFGQEYRHRDEEPIEYDIKPLNEMERPTERTMRALKESHGDDDGAAE